MVINICHALFQYNTKSIYFNLNKYKSEINKLLKKLVISRNKAALCEDKIKGISHETNSKLRENVLSKTKIIVLLIIISGCNRSCFKYFSTTKNPRV